MGKRLKINFDLKLKMITNKLRLLPKMARS